MENNKRDDKTIVDLWIDLTDGFMDKIRAVGMAMIAKNIYVPTRKGNPTTTGTIGSALNELYGNIDNLTDIELLQLEERYLEHRAHKAKTTGIKLNTPMLNKIDILAEKLSAHGLGHVYHGGSPNRKLVCLCALYYVLNKHLPPPKQ